MYKIKFKPAVVLCYFAILSSCSSLRVSADDCSVGKRECQILNIIDKSASIAYEDTSQFKGNVASLKEYSSDSYRTLFKSPVKDYEYILNILDSDQVDQHHKSLVLPILYCLDIDKFAGFLDRELYEYFDLGKLTFETTESFLKMHYLVTDNFANDYQNPKFRNSFSKFSSHSFDDEGFSFEDAIKKNLAGYRRKGGRKYKKPLNFCSHQ